MSQIIPVVAIVGRTNVGKSTLFNALAKRRLAIVQDRPGVTRDRNYALISQYGAPFTLVDTGGLVGEDEADAPSEILDSVQAQAQIAIEESDLVLAVFDGLCGVHPQDQEVVDVLRRSGRPVLWVINKCEKALNEVLAAEFYGLGLDEIFPVSAAHRIGINELVRKIQAQLGLASEAVEKAGLGPVDAIRVAVLGRPNVGKSSLVNKLLGQERLIISSMPGTTRDSIDSELTKSGQRYVLIDTAGLRKKARIEPLTVERFSNLRTLRSLARCDVAVLVMDATLGAPSDQEQKIASLIHERGRGLVLVVNKWDAIEKDHRTVKEYSDAVYQSLQFVRYAPIVFTSALSGRRCPNVLEKVKLVHENAHKRLATSELNKLLGRAMEHNPPPVHRGAPVKLFFATQIQVAPPTIVLFLNDPDGLRPSYIRYLQTWLRDAHPFEGVDVKFVKRKRTEKTQRKISAREEAEQE